MDKYEVEIAPVKRRLFADLADSERSLSIVELGIGAGPNLQYYARPDRADRIVGVDVNRAMFGYAKAKIDALEAEGTGPGPTIDLVIGDAEATGLADASADAVVATLLLCSVADQAKVLSINTTTVFGNTAVQSRSLPPQERRVPAGGGGL